MVFSFMLLPSEGRAVETCKFVSHSAACFPSFRSSTTPHATLPRQPSQCIAVFST